MFRVRQQRPGKDASVDLQAAQASRDIQTRQAPLVVVAVGIRSGRQALSGLHERLGGLITGSHAFSDQSFACQTLLGCRTTDLRHLLLPADLGGRRTTWSWSVCRVNFSCGYAVDKIEPTLVFKEILSHSVGDINHILDRTETFLEQKFRDVHSGICIFIDKADQAMRKLPREAWIHVQAGLIEAAWDAMNANSHVKIFASIRQEAFSNYESDIKTNLFGATATIHYTDKELRDLLDQLTRCYERHQSFQEFIHINAVRHAATGYCEDAFQYLDRHSLGRPRDLVIIASELSRRQDELGEPAFRRVVDEVSSRVIVANVFDETRVFLDAVREREDRLRFLSLIPRNILTCDEIFEVSAQFNGIDVRDAEDVRPRLAAKSIILSGNFTARACWVSWNHRSMSGTP